MEHFYVKFGDPSYVSFWDIVQKSRQTEVKKTLPMPLTLTLVMKEEESV